MKHILILLTLLLSTTGEAQSVKLNPVLKIDTLTIWMDYSDEITEEFQLRLQESVVKAVNRFNLEEKGFKVILDSARTLTSMRMKMGAIDYVDAKDNILWTGIGLVTLAGHAYAISATGITLPFLLLPSTFSKVQIETSKGLVTNKPKFSRFFINPFGMYKRIIKQENNMVKKAEKSLFKFLLKLGKQYEKNNS